MTIFIETDRLILRNWQEEDKKPYWLMNQDPAVLEFLLGPLSMQQVEEFITNMKRQMQERNYTLFAACIKDTKKFIGFIGLNYTDFKADFTPATEIGWRLDSKYWGKGFATEGAKAVLKYGFEQIGLKEIVSFTALENIRSRRVMEKIGLIQDKKGIFAHPKLSKDHKLSEHVLYRLSN